MRAIESAIRLDDVLVSCGPNPVLGRLGIRGFAVPLLKGVIEGVGVSVIGDAEGTIGRTAGVTIGVIVGVTGGTMGTTTGVTTGTTTGGTTTGMTAGTTAQMSAVIVSESVVMVPPNERPRPVHVVLAPTVMAASSMTVPTKVVLAARVVA